MSLTKRQEAKLEGGELKMLRYSLRVMRMDRMRNKYIRGIAQVGRFRDTVRGTKRMLRMEPPGRRRRGRPNRRSPP